MPEIVLVPVKAVHPGARLGSHQTPFPGGGGLLESRRVLSEVIHRLRASFGEPLMKNRLIGISKVCLVALVVVATGCYSVTSRPDGAFKVATPPTFEQRQDFYLWGLVGESHIDTKQVCAKSQTVQMQSQMTFVDGLLGLITLGIYSPQTAKVGCK